MRHCFLNRRRVCPLRFTAVGDDVSDVVEYALAGEAEQKDCQDGETDDGVKAVALDGEADDCEGYAGDGSGDEQKDSYLDDC